MYSKQIRDERVFPKISVITVSYNAEDTIARTLESVVRQSYKNIEYIVVDGASTDQTVDIVNRYRQQIHMILSEPDDGIYDAMNKGIRYASGDYLYFLGADDWLCDCEVIRMVADFMAAHLGFSFYMGNVFLYESVHRLMKRKRPGASAEDMKRGEMCPHQGLFTSRRLMQEGFDTRYQLAADYELLLRHIMRGETYCLMDVDVAYYSLFGASAEHSLYDEYITIISQYAGDEYLDRIYKIREKDTDESSFRSRIKSLLMGLLGEKRFLCLQGWKNFDGTL